MLFLKQLLTVPFCYLSNHLPVDSYKVLNSNLKPDLRNYLKAAVIDDCAKDGGKEFLPRCIAFFYRIPIESLRIRH